MKVRGRIKKPVVRSKQRHLLLNDTQSQPNTQRAGSNVARQSPESREQGDTAIDPHSSGYYDRLPEDAEAPFPISPTDSQKAKIENMRQQLWSCDDTASETAEAAAHTIHTREATNHATSRFTYVLTRVSLCYFQLITFICIETVRSPTATASANVLTLLQQAEK
jgi:hypothetical protein